jgi:hypothetical protein
MHIQELNDVVVAINNLSNSIDWVGLILLLMLCFKNMGKN